MKFLLDLTEPKIMAIMIAFLFFLLSLLINLLQYHHYKRRTDRFIQKEESLLHFLIRFSKIIKKIGDIDFLKRYRELAQLSSKSYQLINK